MSDDSSDIPEGLLEARRLLQSCRRVTVFTGAGMSAESGIPTFRGDGGLWRGRRPEEWATPEAFLQSPETVREFYEWRRQIVAEAQPHVGHRVLGEWSRRGSPQVMVVTQNVDGLHQRSGCRDVLELHGSLWSQHCHDCLTSEEDLDKVHCACGGRLRPSVVWFGEGLPADIWVQSERAMQESDLIMVIGTSAVVYPAAGLVGLAGEAGVPIVEINPEPALQNQAITLQGTAAEVLPELLSETSK
jgi:NAD-dependent deacetylase